jgi:hypothetical protein
MGEFDDLYYEEALGCDVDDVMELLKIRWIMRVMIGWLKMQANMAKEIADNCENSSVAWAYRNQASAWKTAGDKLAGLLESEDITLEDILP